jgi:3D (Asp-Asp-Asp) domain-containing protein
MIASQTGRVRIWFLLVSVLGFLGGCRTGREGLETIPSSRRSHPEMVRVDVTAYCPCGVCCNWRRNWLGRPVLASGPRKGRHKEIGITASGTRAQPGTIAADPRVFPFGTVLFIPGYGYGRVEDTGRDITGNRIDVFFTRHARAGEWGRQPLDARVWRP